MIIGVSKFALRKQNSFRLNGTQISERTNLIYCAFARGKFVTFTKNLFAFTYFKMQLKRSSS